MGNLPVACPTPRHRHGDAGRAHRYKPVLGWTSRTGRAGGQSLAEKPMVEPKGSELPPGRGRINPPRAKKRGI